MEKGSCKPPHEGEDLRYKIYSQEELEELSATLESIGMSAEDIEKFSRRHRATSQEEANLPAEIPGSPDL